MEVDGVLHIMIDAHGDREYVRIILSQALMVCPLNVGKTKKS